MEFDLDNMGGTSIDKLRNMNQDNDIDIDYSKILEDINNTSNNTNVNNKLCDSRDNMMKSIKSNNMSKKKKKNINMNSFVRNLETNLENLNNNDNNVDSIKINDNPKIVTNSQEGYYDMICNFKYMDILLSVLLFLLLNNKLSIETIYRIPNMSLDNPYPNLIIRAIIFGLLLFIIKKYYL